MTHALNVQPNPVTVVLTQYAVAHGFDYTTALMAAHATAKEVHDYNAADLASRTLERCAS